MPRLTPANDSGAQSLRCSSGYLNRGVPDSGTGDLTTNYDRYWNQHRGYASRAAHRLDRQAEQADNPDDAKHAAMLDGEAGVDLWTRDKILDVAQELRRVSKWFERPVEEAS